MKIRFDLRTLAIGRVLAGSSALALQGLAWPVAAQPAAVVEPNAAPAVLEGRLADGSRFRLADRRGKVVLVYYWRTDCAVCRSVMAELRANVEGWQGRPFELVAVSQDPRREDLLAYLRILDGTVSAPQRFPVLWAGEIGHIDTVKALGNRLPVHVILDPQGRVVLRQEGRLSGVAWDRIAELLP